MLPPRAPPNESLYTLGRRGACEARAGVPERGRTLRVLCMVEESESERLGPEDRVSSSAAGGGLSGPERRGGERFDRLKH
jgi:hypothetical protein